MRPVSGLIFDPIPSKSCQALQDLYLGGAGRDTGTSFF